MKTQFAPGVRNEKRANQIRILHKQNTAPTEIAKKLGVANGTVSYYLSKLGLSKHRNSAKRKIEPIVLASTPTERILDVFWNALDTSDKINLVKHYLEQ